MDNPNAFSADSLSCSHLGHQNTLGSLPISSAWTHPQLLPLSSMSQGVQERLVMPFRRSDAPQGFCSGLPSAPMDCLPASGSSGSSYCSSSITARDQGVLPAITEDYIHLGFVSDDIPYPNDRTQESSLLLGSNSFSSSANYLNRSSLYAQETPYGIGNLEQRGCDFVGNNLGEIVTQRSPYVDTPYNLFDGSEASSSQSNQGGGSSGITGQCFSCGGLLREAGHHTSELNSVSTNPFLSTLSRGSENMDEVEQIRDVVMLGPISPLLAMKEEVLPHLLTLLDDDDIVTKMNIMNGVLCRSSFYKVIKDKYGHQLVNKLLDKCGLMDKVKIVFLVMRANKLLHLVKDRHGNCSVKKLVASVKGSPELCDCVTYALSKIVSDLMTNALGFSLIECCLEHLTCDQNSFIFEEAQRNCHRLARDRKGVFILNLCIKMSNRSYREEIMGELVQDTIGLAQDASGNFAIQFILELKDLDMTKMICSEVSEHLIELSLHKTGSYVVEKCLKSSEGRLLLQKLENCTEEVLEEISTHPFGNYVLQTALKVEKKKRCHPMLICRITQILNNLRSYPYAINILKYARLGQYWGHDFSLKSWRGKPSSQLMKLPCSSPSSSGTKKTCSASMFQK